MTITNRRTTRRTSVLSTGLAGAHASSEEPGSPAIFEDKEQAGDQNINLVKIGSNRIQTCAELYEDCHTHCPQDPMYTPSTLLPFIGYHYSFWPHSVSRPKLPVHRVTSISMVNHLYFTTNIKNSFSRQSFPHSASREGLHVTIPSIPVF